MDRYIGTDNIRDENKQASFLQVRTLQKLIAEREVSQVMRSVMNDLWEQGRFTTGVAYNFISELSTLPYREGFVPMDDRKMVGYHAVDDRLFLVKLSKNNNLYARELIFDNDGVLHQVYAPEALAFLSYDTKLARGQMRG